MVHGENRIPYWIDRRLTGLAGPEYHAIISIGLPFEPEDSQYGKSRIGIGRVIAILVTLASSSLVVGAGPSSLSPLHLCGGKDAYS